MRGFLSLEPNAETRRGLGAIQNRLHDSLARQGVHFSDRFGVTLLVWPFGTFEELDEAFQRLQGYVVPSPTVLPFRGRPNDDRPAEVGFEVDGLGPIQEALFQTLKSTLDPDPPKTPFIRLARVSPASRKVGVALRGSSLIGVSGPRFVAESLTLWQQSPQGYEAYRTMALSDGGS